MRVLHVVRLKKIIMRVNKKISFVISIRVTLILLVILNRTYIFLVACYLLVSLLFNESEFTNININMKL